MPRQSQPKTAEDAAREIAGECLVVRTRLLNRVISRLYDEAFRPLGATTAQMNILMAITVLEQPAPQQIADRLLIEKSTLSRNLDRMEENGWIRRLPGDDPRSFRLDLTAKGRRLIVEATDAWRGAQRRATELLGEQDAAAVFRAGDRLLWRDA